MRYLAPAFLSLALCVVASAAPAKVTESDVEFLIASATKDFSLSNPAGSIRFYEVRVGRIPLTEGEIQPMLCGEFQTPNAERTPFATIKTSGYEQWNGATAKSLCENVSVVWVEGLDLTSRLQNKFDTPR